MKKIKKSGFTLIELITAIVIMGILLAITMNSYINSLNKSKLANLKVNMSTFQTMLETYAVKNDNIYPVNSDELRIDGLKTGTDKPYWRDFNNPITGAIGKSNSSTSPGSYTDIIGSLPVNASRGVVAYNPMNESGKVTSIYFIYSAGFKGEWLKDDSITGNPIYIISNAD
ncbi:MAG: type II secretion system protein [Candidatus Sericytochromatia bacterium]